MIIDRFAKIKVTLFSVLFVLTGEQMNHSSMNSKDVLSSFNILLGGS